MAISKNQQKSVAKYVKNHYDDIKVRVPKGERDIIQAHAEVQGETTNAFINRAIKEAIERDTSK
ncbi:MAG: hypothetical protein IJ437_01085 [Clostridia bacterium]|nr:hypothetical protein [Clostridia bacterium]